ncbi:CapA family protein [Bacillus sp. HMF5848]|uniref:CapA family protein n=1 Tax=Bacillus sp. HMF5848 TaxID=2495421 RepID=UPI000F78DAA1|nr:CapA family protein [Bacillus sp. HMF5848]RSK27149.1 CapA family protein [Bacillus sp. HMF5848]
MKPKAQIFLLVVVMTAVWSTVIYLFFFEETQGSNSVPIFAHTHPVKTVMADQEKSYSQSLTLAAVGDILIHSTVYNAAKTNGTYDFMPMFTGVKDILTNADLTFANQESIIGGSEIGVSTYPRFNSPYEIASTLQDVGVDIVSMANNHTLDRGFDAIKNAIDFYNSIGMKYVGSYDSQEDANTPRILVRNGIRVGFLAYTYGTNGLIIPKEHPYAVNLIDSELITSDIQKLRDLADIVVVSMHWGNEYMRLPNTNQQQLAKSIIMSGADIIIGHHPHVLQPMEWIERDDNSQGLVVYSLGNFISGQMRDYKDIGGIVEIDIVKTIHSNRQSTVTIAKPRFTPTYNHTFNNTKFYIEPLTSSNDVHYPNYDEIMHHMFQSIDGK